MRSSGHSSSGAVSTSKLGDWNLGSGGSTFATYIFSINANNSNSIYIDNGKVMPLSISKQSYIIYK